MQMESVGHSGYVAAARLGECVDTTVRSQAKCSSCCGSAAVSPTCFQRVLLLCCCCCCRWLHVLVQACCPFTSANVHQSVSRRMQCAVVLRSRQFPLCVFPLLLLVLQVAAPAGAGVLSSDVSSWQPQLFAVAGQHLSAAALSQHCTSCHSSAAAAAGLAAAGGGVATSGTAKVGHWVAAAFNAIGICCNSVDGQLHCNSIALEHSEGAAEVGLLVANPSIAVAVHWRLDLQCTSARNCCRHAVRISLSPVACPACCCTCITSS
jgi:hypothetical protein